ncbi:MAG: exosortase C-terminal domain/associated protein EpsI, partial [Terriglobales bacterium]
MKLPAQARRHWLLITILLLATFSVRSRLGASPSVPLREPLNAFPDKVGNWSLLSQPAMTPDVVQVLNADDYTLRIYQNPQGAQAQFFVAYYRTQRAGESMHSPKNCLPGAGWEPIQSDTIPFPAGGAAARINRYVVQKGT